MIGALQEQWLNIVVLLDVITFIRRAVESNFIDFQVIQREEVNGLLPSSAKTGNPMNIHGYAASILYQARRATIL